MWNELVIIKFTWYIFGVKCDIKENQTSTPMRWNRSPWTAQNDFWPRNHNSNCTEISSFLILYFCLPHTLSTQYPKLSYYPTSSGVIHLYLYICIFHLIYMRQNVRTSFRKISWSLVSARFGFRLFQSLRNLTGTSAAPLPRCLSNSRALRSL